jgi:hypothetical protein
MITTRAVPALLPAHHRRVATAPVSTRYDFADPCQNRQSRIRSSGGSREPVQSADQETLDGARTEERTKAASANRRYGHV